MKLKNNVWKPKGLIALLCFFLVLSTPVTAQLAAWNPAGLANYGPSPWAPTSTAANITVGGLTRGAATTTNSSGAGSAWGALGWQGAATADVTFTVTSNPGYQVSYSTFNLFYRRSSTGPPSGTLEYAIGNGTYTPITSLAFTSVSSSGATVTPVTLSGISDLQNVPPGTVIKFRIFPSGASAAGGTWYIFSAAGMNIAGSVTPFVASGVSASIAQTASIQCNGQASAALTASASGVNSPFTYSWSPAGGTSSVATGLSAGIYSCLVTSATSETVISTYTVTEPAVLSSTISNQKNVSCHGGSNGSATVTAGGGTSPYTYTWSPAGGNATTATNLSTGNYTVTITDANACPVTSKTLAINEPATLTTTVAQANASCNGGANGSATVSPMGGTPAYSYTWSAAGGNTTTVNNLTAGNYTVTTSDSQSCTTVQTFTITQPSTFIPVSASASSSVVCSGSTITLNATGLTTYTWSNGVNNGNAFTPSATAVYTITGADASGCNALGTVSVTVNNTPTITVNSGVICPGGTFILTPGGASTYTYSSGSATVSPSSSSTYTVNGTSAQGCIASAVAIASVDVSGSLNVSISGPSVICNGDVAGLTANGASTYTWSTGALTYTIAPTPTSNTTYTVTGASGSCSNTAVKTVSVNALPAVSISGTGIICAGSSLTLTASGAATYTWNTNATTTSITPTPTAGVNYTVVGTDANGCSNTAVKSITVNPTPTVVVPNGTICAGASFTFNPSGASTYTLSGGTPVTPAVTTTYSAIGTNSFGCTSTAPVIYTVTVNALPVITVNSGSVCAGKVFSMTPSGAFTYTYSNGSSTVIPTANASYSVTGTSSVGCVSSTPAIASVTVNALPVITVNSGSVCAGKVFTMTPSGASTYTYSNNSSTVIPTANTSYSVTGTGSLGCVSSTPAIAGVTVNAVPVLTVNSGSTCAGVAFIINPTGASTYTFSGGTATVTPSANTSYSVAGTSSLGCVSTTSAISTVTVISAPVITVNSGSVCAGNGFTITPAGASTYTFLNGATVVNPSTTTSYSITGTSSVGCASQNTVASTVTVIALPVTAITGNTAVCRSSSLSLEASGAVTYTWNTGSNSATLIATPLVNTIYTVTGSNASSCTNSATYSVTVNPTPTITIANSAICPGDSFTLNPSGAVTYTFSNGPVVAPMTTTSYSVAGTNSLGCVSQNSAVAVVTVTNSIVVSVSGSTVICSGQSATLTASGANSYTWNTGAITTSVTPSPATATIYTVTGSSGSCSNTAVISVNVLATPTISVAQSNSVICQGESVTLTASGADIYTWTNGISNGTAFSPTLTATYTITGSSTNGCAGFNTSQITVNTNPVLNISSNTTIICSGSDATLSVNGASTYSWSNNATTAEITITPSVTTGYSVTGTDVNGCKTTTVISQEVSPCTGIAANELNKQLIAVYPNPNNGDFIIKADAAIRLVLVNELGQTIRIIEQTTAGNVTEVKGLTPGVYFLTGSDIRLSVKQKIIVTR